ncbi:OmpA family protein [bacterium]|nr:OmpA family protein [bacterium]
MNKLLTAFLAVIFSLGFRAQDNLVPNSDFEILIKKVKEEGMIGLAEGWKSPTLAPADLYVTNTNNGLISVPDNAYGAEKPMRGSNYAGILAYSYKSKEPRSYLQVKLKQKLIAGKKYCVKFHVSLADLSKYACNNIAAYLSPEAVSAKNSDVFKQSAQIVSKHKVIYAQQYYWVPVCRVFEAKGDEEHLTIGNFTAGDKLITKKIKRPKGFTKPQTYDAYYYIDNVSVSENVDKCNCDFSPKKIAIEKRSFGSTSSGDNKFVNSDGSSSGTSNSESIVLLNVDSLNIEFPPNSFSITGEPINILKKVVVYLKKNKSVVITLSGHIDSSESEVDELAIKRVSSIYKYLVSQGVSKERVKQKVIGDDQPFSTEDRLKNMRVEITELKSK